jgi:hypothetical protein
MGEDMRGKKAKVLRRIAKMASEQKETVYTTVKGTEKLRVQFSPIDFQIIDLRMFKKLSEEVKKTAWVAFGGQRLMLDCVRKEYKISKQKLRVV